MAVIPFPDRRPWRLRCLLVEFCVELEIARRGLGLPDSSRPRLYLVSAPDELEPEWDSEDSGAYQDRIEAGLEPEWPDD
jgi:hypothetical protein